MQRTGAARPDERVALRAHVRAVSQSSGLPVVLGGAVRDGQLLLTEFSGIRTAALCNLAVRSGSGLGGRVIAQRRPAGVRDYSSARTITHDYDRPVRAEGLTSMIAVPVTVDGVCRAVLYGALRERAPIGDRGIDALGTAARRLAQEYLGWESADQRLTSVEALAPGREPGEVAGTRGTRTLLAQLHEELEDIASAIDDPSLQARLHAVAARFGLPAPAPRAGAPSAISRCATLTPRELDVLWQVALGCSNREAGARLGLAAETVKAYLRSAMHKLDAHSRHEAVERVRLAGLFP